MDILLIIGLILVGYAIGTMHSTYKFMKLMRDAAEEIGIDLEKEIADKEVPKKVVYKFSVEKHGDLLYLFDRENDGFVCQGSSVQELAQLAKKYKNITMATAIYNDKIFMFTDGQSKEYTGNES